MEIQASWFGSGHPQNAKPATVEIGALPNGLITITTDIVGVEANDYTIEVVEGVGNNIPMSASLVGTALVITLGTDGAGALDATLNTATLIIDEINGLTGITAGFSGDGSGVIGAAVPEGNFVGGQYGTFCPDPFAVVRVWDGVLLQWDYYTAIAPNDRYDANWRKFNLATY